MKKTIIIEGMSCNNCVGHVKEALEELGNVTSVEVNLQEKCATVETSESNEILKEAIEDAGYDVVEIK
ncbi:UNVERIFIED_ORG: heavy metal transport/detoxification protein [Clostridium botulinum]|uniref:heavy-metal-associated domain-containing protein n=1 Tax=Clostridium TaxID=1485 RepID=UPI00037C40BA|nr:MULTISPECIES: heavy metal-associated domain-containing protein [Clostridium]KIL08101.1 heavy metal transport/detoxification protein [Clostridium botulinum]MBN1036748.1 heavy-metal-associated domain-containing protein [Clostridium botulinum]MBY6810001.1 heavy-metal-associated domain-containing protein [Clostridium botulinum]MBY6823657.1 heavy-metal-associated domain-containing protein [Clostridium botulinum]MBY6834268.1 heavy-metal-associated domain-containing protein [Clostridium botulinum]